MSYTGQWMSGSSGQSGSSNVEGYSKDSSSHKKSRHNTRTQRQPDTSGVLTNETVKVYGIGRYVDSSDPRILHERHAVYRLEETPSWRLQPPARQPEVLMGPIVGLRKPEYAPEPLQGEVGRDLIATKQNTQAAIDGVKTVTGDEVKMRQELNDNLKRVNENEETLAKELADLKRRMEEAGDKQPQRKQAEGNPTVVPKGISER